MRQVIIYPVLTTTGLQNAKFTGLYQPGKTKAEAITNIKEAIQLYRSLDEKSQPILEEHC